MEVNMKRIIILSWVTVALFIVCLGCSSKPLEDKGVTILSPKANEAVSAGGAYEIQWKAEPSQSEFGAAVTIEFSKDGGNSWEIVKENVPNTMKYMGQVPKADSKECKIRVFSQFRPIYRGTSEMFSVK